jgi:hypothetical protein
MHNFLNRHKIYCEKSKKQRIQDLILGKKYSDAEKLYNNLRIVKEDNKSKTVIMNFCEDRCNVEVINGKIINISGFY